MRLAWMTALLLIPTAFAADFDLDVETPSLLDTAFNPPDLVPRLCAGALGQELFVPVQYAYADEVPVVLLMGTTSGSFRVSWGIIDGADHGAVHVQGTTLPDEASSRGCGISADPASLDGLTVAVLGTSASKAAGSYDIQPDSKGFLVSTDAGQQFVRADHRTHWHDDVGYWNFAPYYHEVVLGARLTAPACVDDPMACDPIDPIRGRLGV